MPHNAKHEVAVIRILQASLETLQSKGASGFSTPEVARRMGLRQSHITYYFPTRKELLLATTDFALRKYENEFNSQLSHLRKFTLSKSQHFLDWLFTDSISSDTVKTFPELWSLANSDRDIAEQVKNLYVLAAEAVVSALDLNPKEKGSKKLIDILLVIASVSEGITALHGHRKTDDRIFLQAKKDSVKILAPLLFSAYSEARKKSSRHHKIAHKK